VSNKIETFPVGKVLAGGVAEDGSQLMVRIELPTGEPFRLGIAADQVQTLLTVVSHGALELARKADTSGGRQVMQISHWDLLQSTDGELVLSVRLPGGGESAFQLPQGSAERLIAFAAALQASLSRPEDASVN